MFLYNLPTVSPEMHKLDPAVHGRGRQRLLGHLDHSNHGNLVGLESFTFCTSRDSPADLSMGGGFFSIYAASSGKSGNLFQEISVQS